MPWCTKGGSAEGIRLRQRQQDVRNELAAATTATEPASAKAAPSSSAKGGKKDNKAAAGAGMSQQQLDELRENKERLEAELTQLEVSECFLMLHVLVRFRGLFLWMSSLFLVLSCS